MFFLKAANAQRAHVPKQGAFFGGSLSSAFLAPNHMFFGYKLLFLHKNKKQKNKNFYEESIVLVRSSDIRSANIRIGRYAREYESKSVRLIGVISVVPVLDEIPSNTSEVFCSFRLSKLPPRSYLKCYYLSPNDLSPGWPGWWKEFDKYSCLCLSIREAEGKKTNQRSKAR